MQGRKFSRQGDVAAIDLRERAFRKAGLDEIEDALLETKTRLAASVSRLRIGGSALTLGKTRLSGEELSLTIYLKNSERTVLANLRDFPRVSRNFSVI